MTRRSLRRKVGHPARVDDPATLEKIARAATLYLEGWAQWEIAQELNVSERTVRNYLVDANKVFRERAEALVSAALATALERRRVFARNLAEVREALSTREKKSGKLFIDEKRAKEIISAIRAEMTNQDRVEKLTGAEPAEPAGGPSGVMGRLVRIRGAHGILYEYYIDSSGKVAGEKIVEVSDKVVVGEDDGEREADVN